ncbi:hypothetical protein EAO27_18270 [Sphingopyxis sp. YF1]|jgi:hypothetical protein|uniref:hypothetical protein n=1 Tax=Sphingopyxis sp. YF1 TaxID=2482763 RepID=UPI001F61F841|nr:hypothetical protein [Sphingopyxis sp. YF1]UNU44435.1 hypothetical protein EAO27_18270 [Sphingopyxis sp. YF1]
MRAAFTSLMLILSMLFGSLVVPAFADAGTAGHAFEILDTDCHAETRDDARDAPGDPGQPAAIHVDHHHCSNGLVPPATGAARTGLRARGPLFPVPASMMEPHDAAPLTEPPAA